MNKQLTAKDVGYDKAKIRDFRRAGYFKKMCIHISGHTSYKCMIMKVFFMIPTKTSINENSLVFKTYDEAIEWMKKQI